MSQSDGMEWLIQVKLFVDTSAELSFVLSSVSFHATSICIGISATHMLVHFFLNVCFNVFCMTLLTTVKISIKNMFREVNYRLQLECCLESYAVLELLFEISLKFQPACTVLSVCHINKYLFLAFSYYRENSLDSTLCKKTLRLISACSSK